MILPVAVTLNRLDADFFVLRRAMDLGIGGRTVAGATLLATTFWTPFLSNSEDVSAAVKSASSLAVLLVQRARTRLEDLVHPSL
jgi:uncharacterized membrane protein YedE/YeeE